MPVVFIYCVIIALVSPLSMAVPAVKEYHYKIVTSFPHSRTVFTQGLEFHNNRLYESAGLYGYSKVFSRTLESTTPLHQHTLSKSLFAEGITLFNNQLFQLTWQSGQAFIYHADTLKPQGKFTINGQGWGLTNNGKQLIFSNGSDQLIFIDPANAKILRTVKVTFQGKPLHRLNELEWVNGLIYANIWQSNWIVMINPNNGAVTGRVNLTNLLPKLLYTSSTNVLNGIAYDAKKDRLFVTGKNWPKLYQIKLYSKPQ